MNDPDISTMTPDAMRREIAERLGWHVERDGSRCYMFSSDNELMTTLGYPDEDTAWTYTIRSNRIPDWPADPGAALELCLRIAQGKPWDVLVGELTSGYYAWFVIGSEEVMHVFGDTPALALSRLALAALRNKVRTIA